MVVIVVDGGMRRPLELAWSYRSVSTNALPPSRYGRLSAEHLDAAVTP